MASRRVREELRKYGLLASEEKSAWGARQVLVWTGFLWDTRKFKLFVTEDKLKRVEHLLVEILEQRFVKVRKLARVAGNGECDQVSYKRDDVTDSYGGG